MMTAKLVDDVTDTHLNKTREFIGQGSDNPGIKGGRRVTSMVVVASGAEPQGDTKNTG